MKPRGRVGLVVVAVTLVVGGAVVVAAAAPHRENHGTSSEVAEPADLPSNDSALSNGTWVVKDPPAPLPEEDTVVIDGTDLRVPVPRGSGLKAMNQTSFVGHEGVRFEGVTFQVPGPLEGTIVGSLNVTAISNVPVPVDVTELARQVDPSREAHFIEVDGTEVAYWVDTGSLDGSEFQRPSRTLASYAFASLDGRSVIQVNLDGIDVAFAARYVEELVRGLR